MESAGCARRPAEGPGIAVKKAGVQTSEKPLMGEGQRPKLKKIGGTRYSTSCDSALGRLVADLRHVAIRLHTARRLLGLGLAQGAG